MFKKVHIVINRSTKESPQHDNVNNETFKPGNSEGIFEAIFFSLFVILRNQTNKKELISSGWYLMNGLFVTLPLLLLFFPSLYTSNPPILVLKKKAFGIRVLLHLQVVND